jgi:hypothetical protein
MSCSGNYSTIVLVVRASVCVTVESTLSLFVARIAAHNVNDATTTHDFTLITNTLNAGFDFHRSTQLGPRDQGRCAIAALEWRETLEYKAWCRGSSRAEFLRFLVSSDPKA